MSGGLRAGRCYKEREVAVPARMFSRLLFPTGLSLSNVSQVKVEAIKAGQYTPCGPGEGQEGGLGHARRYKERDIAQAAAV